MEKSKFDESYMMFARYDGKPPREISTSGKNKTRIPFYTDKNGIVVYVTNDQKVVSRLISGNPERYRLYRSKPFYMRITNPATGGIKYEMAASWNYRIETVAAGIDPENKEQLFEKKVVWYEDPEGKEAVVPSVEEITGKKDSSVVDTVTELIREKKKNTDLSATVDALTKKIEALSSSSIKAEDRENAVEGVPVKEGDVKNKKAGRPPKFSIE